MPQRVLLVENNDDHRRLLSILLRDAGLVPVPAWNAEDGLDILNDCACDLAVFDIQLPGMDGLEALSVVAEKLPRLPVVLVTASGDVREAHARSLGAKGFLRKPFSASEFLDAVGAALGSDAGTPSPQSRVASGSARAATRRGRVASGPSTKDTRRGSQRAQRTMNGGDVRPLCPL